MKKRLKTKLALNKDTIAYLKSKGIKGGDTYTSGGQCPTQKLPCTKDCIDSKR